MKLSSLLAVFVVISTPSLAQQPPSSPSPAAAQQPPPSFFPTVKVGAKVTRAVPGLKRVAIGDPSVADLTVDSGGVTVSGVAVGQTTVLLWFADGSRGQWLVKVVK